LDGYVNIATPAGERLFTQLSFAPYGIAINNTRGRVYFSNQTGNEILVYSTSGTLLKVIQ